LKQLKALFLVPLLAAGCGSSPLAPTAAPTPAAAPRLAVTIAVSPSGAGGFTAPTSLSLKMLSPGGVLHVETVSYRMVDAQGRLLAEAFIDTATAGNSDPNRYVSGDTIVQTLTWPSDRGKGAKLDLVVTYRDASGVLNTHSLSFPAQ
jgi:hypothetical protein